ncbi:hypothetical protein [Blastococcus sp. CCUG 61487]|uniref:hypothetical protein n=1 Tax=Blastococcus sp. CCUG 61487 TaxID=1840703 RepID=UPI0010C01ABD|nr:hypothetical protein [Blastococcus sp. CCUG 61487]TKJ19642.1 hypothetical protein A6V29_00735 [Blastococcus sp. CCUG 61487]
MAIDERDLDGVLGGYLLLRDPVGSDPDNSQAHGSCFDRVSAFSEGHDGGVTFCRDDFGPDRLSTAETFDQDELADRGNAAYVATLRIVDDTLPPFWRDVLLRGFGREFDEPAIRPFDRVPPPCGTEELDLTFCAADSTVYYDETELVRPAYQQLGTSRSPPPSPSPTRSPPARSSACRSMTRPPPARRSASPAGTRPRSSAVPSPALPGSGSAPATSMKP